MAAVECSEQGGHFPVELNGGVATSELPVGLAEIINVKALNPAHPVAGHLSDVFLLHVGVRTPSLLTPTLEFSGTVDRTSSNSE